MSEERLPCGIFYVKTSRFKGKKNVKIELFKAEQWQRKFRPYKKNTHPQPPTMDRDGTYWPLRYRIRVNDRWYGVEGMKFTFYTLPEVLQLIGYEFENLTS